MALAVEMAKRGAKLSLCSRNLPDFQPAGGLVERCDISKPAEVSRWLAETVKKLGRIDILINNASILGPRCLIADYPKDAWDEVMSVNVNAVFYVTKTCLNLAMLKQGSGVILNITSGVGRIGKARWGAYAASKFALEGINQMLSNELKEKGIISVCLNPEATATAMRAAAYPREDPGTLKSPQELAAAVAAWLPKLRLEDSGKSFDYKDIRL